jgi:hypothetical protein
MKDRQTDTKSDIQTTIKTKEETNKQTNKQTEITLGGLVVNYTRDTNFSFLSSLL